MNKRPSSVLIALFLALPSAALASESDEFVLPASFEKQQVRRLSLQEALEIAIANNLGIKMQAQQVRVGKAGIRANRAAFEPRVTARFDHSDSISPPASSLDGMPGDTFESQSQRWSAGINQRLHTGTTLGLGFSSARNKSSLGSAVEPLFYGSNLSLSIDQPLLRGFSFDRDIPKAGILRAEFSDEKNLEQKRIVIAREVRRTEDAYWNLAEAMRSFSIQQASLQLAREQLILTQRQITAGILAPADLIGSESSVAQRELALVRSEASLGSAMDNLRHALGLGESDWSDVILAVDIPTVEVRVVTLEDAMNDALTRRPEIRQNLIDDEIASLDRRVAKNDLLPDLNVGFRYGLVGQSNVYSGSLSQLEGLGARNWGLFVNLSWAPLGRAASANKDSLQSSNRIRKLQHQQFLNALRMEIRGALRTLETAQRQVVASERFRGLAERSLDAERKRFLNGKSRNVEVSRSEDELARARTAEVSSRIAFLKATSDLELATGRLLENKNIALSVRAK